MESFAHMLSLPFLMGATTNKTTIPCEVERKKKRLFPKALATLPTCKPVNRREGLGVKGESRRGLSRVWSTPVLSLLSENSWHTRMKDVPGLDQGCPTELPAAMEMVYNCADQYGLHRAVEHLKCV